MSDAYDQIARYVIEHRARERAADLGSDPNPADVVEQVAGAIGHSGSEAAYIAFRRYLDARRRAGGYNAGKTAELRHQIERAILDCRDPAGRAAMRRTIALPYHGATVLPDLSRCTVEAPAPESYPTAPLDAFALGGFREPGACEHVFNQFGVCRECGATVLTIVVRLAAEHGLDPADLLPRSETLAAFPRGGIVTPAAVRRELAISPAPAGPGFSLVEYREGGKTQDLVLVDIFELVGCDRRGIVDLTMPISEQLRIRAQIQPAGETTVTRWFEELGHGYPRVARETVTFSMRRDAFDALGPLGPGDLFELDSGCLGKIIVRFVRMELRHFCSCERCEDIAEVTAEPAGKLTIGSLPRGGGLTEML